MSGSNIQSHESISTSSNDQLQYAQPHVHAPLVLTHLAKSENVSRSNHLNDHPSNTSHPSSDFVPFVSSAPHKPPIANSIDIQYEPRRLYMYDIESHTIHESTHSSNDEKQSQPNDDSNNNLPLSMRGNESESNAHPLSTLFSPLSTSIVAPSLQQNTASVEMNSSRQSLMQSTKLSLATHFSNDIQAFEMWMACCDVHDDRIAYYSALYPLLCEVFAADTKCARVPQQKELEEVIMKHGATKMSLSEAARTRHSSKLSYLVVSSPSHGKKQQQHISDAVSFDFDNPNTQPTTLITISYHAFRKFWKWFKMCCLIIKEMAHLWDVNDHCVVQCNLFCSREECHDILRQAPQGTFLLRLSSVIKGAIVLSYAEPSFSKKDKQFKHTILIRRNPHQFVLRCQSKKGKEKITSISTVVRSFVKIKFLYTPNKLYPKKSIF